MNRSCIADLCFSDKTDTVSGERSRHNVYQMLFIVKGGISLNAADSVYSVWRTC